METYNEPDIGVIDNQQVDDDNCRMQLNIPVVCVCWFQLRPDRHLFLSIFLA
jgi:hypothetical protein